MTDPAILETLSQKLHAYVRECAAGLKDPNKKHLRYSEIVDTAIEFYPRDPFGGVGELVEACERPVNYDPEFIGPPNPHRFPLFVYRGKPMWQVLQEGYKWMI